MEVNNTEKFKTQSELVLIIWTLYVKYKERK